MDHYIMGLIWINMVRVTTHNFYYNITYITVYNYRFDKLEDFIGWLPSLVGTDYSLGIVRIL